MILGLRKMFLNLLDYVIHMIRPGSELRILRTVGLRSRFAICTSLLIFCATFLLSRKHTVETLNSKSCSGR